MKTHSHSHRQIQTHKTQTHTLNQAQTQIDTYCPSVEVEICQFRSRQAHNFVFLFGCLKNYVNGVVHLIPCHPSPNIFWCVFKLGYFNVFHFLNLYTQIFQSAVDNTFMIISKKQNNKGGFWGGGLFLINCYGSCFSTVFVFLSLCTCTYLHISTFTCVDLFLSVCLCAVVQNSFLIPPKMFLGMSQCF